MEKKQSPKPEETVRIQGQGSASFLIGSVIVWLGELYHQPWKE